MITELAKLNIKPSNSEEFEKAFEKATYIISSMNGFIELELQKCIELDDQYMLIVRWDKLEDHTEGFRKSEQYRDWKQLLHHFYDPFPTVEHYSLVKF
jgi:heme-degrading monooxygenase HmoA